MRSCLFFVFFLTSFSKLSAIHVFLNGVEITNLRNETLENVKVKIAANGDIFIEGQQYSAIESNDYVPLNNSLQNISNALKRSAASVPNSSVQVEDQDQHESPSLAKKPVQKSLKVDEGEIKSDQTGKLPEEQQINPDLLLKKGSQVK